MKTLKQVKCQQKNSETKLKLENAIFIANVSYDLFPFQLTTGMISLKAVFVDINITFFTDVVKDKYKKTKLSNFCEKCTTYLF